MDRNRMLIREMLSFACMLDLICTAHVHIVQRFTDKNDYFNKNELVQKKLCPKTRYSGLYKGRDQTAR